MLLLVCLPGTAEILETPSFLVTIDAGCAEGEVACKQAVYTGKSKKSGKSITLRGETLHSMCADGVTPCRFLGYRFKSGAIVYTVTEGGELIVNDRHKTLVHEQGVWRDTR
jgi:hypothetical protein